MPLSNQSILGVSITTSAKKQILSYCASVFSKQSKAVTPITIVTPNAEQIVLAQGNRSFKSILNASDVALPDGAGVVWGLKMAGGQNTKKSKRISGVDFMVDLCRLAADRGSRVFLYGGRAGAAEKALTELKNQIPGLVGFAKDGEEISNEIDKNEMHMTNLNHIKKYIIQEIRGRNIKLVFIGLGAPKQEYLIASLKDQLKNHNVILMAVGGAFDMLAGKIRRAPKVIQTIGFEWFWRLIQEPWRWQRQLALIQFVNLVLHQKIRDN